MSGNSESKERAAEKMQRAVDLLDEYERGIGLPAHVPPGSDDELNEYFTWDRDVIEAISVEQCGAVAYRLAQFSFYIQRESNREIAREKWASTQLEDAVSSELDSYDKYMKYDVKVSLICKENTYAQVLRAIQKKAEQRISRLVYLASSIKNLSDTLIAIQRGKMSKRYE